MILRNVSLDKLGKLSPYAAFRVGIYEDARRMWMHIAHTQKRRGDARGVTDAVRYARDSNRSMLKELSQ